MRPIAPAFAGVLLLVALSGCGDPAGPVGLLDPPLEPAAQRTPGNFWAMFFVDFEEDGTLELSVSQNRPVECDGEGAFGPATGVGVFEAPGGGTSAALSVRAACFRDWEEDADFPEEAVVRGVAYLGFLQLPFRVEFVSNGFSPEPGDALGGLSPDCDAMADAGRPCDEALISIGEASPLLFRGELHHEVQTGPRVGG
jgi:hypothetical protein